MKIPHILNKYNSDNNDDDDDNNNNHHDHNNNILDSFLLRMSLVRAEQVFNLKSSHHDTPYAGLTQTMIPSLGQPWHASHCYHLWGQKPSCISLCVNMDCFCA